MLKKFVLFLALTIGVVHVLSIYLMPNCTYRPPAKNKTHDVFYSENSKHKPDTSSEIPYKVKYRTLLCFNAAKKLSVHIAILIILAISCFTFKLKEFLFEPVTKIFHFNLANLRTSPDFIIGYCCFLI